MSRARTRAPCSTNSDALAAPIPVAAPVMMAVLPLRENVSGTKSFLS
jgi:hypothetical protein